MTTCNPSAGQKAPSFTAITGDGKSISLADFRGKWVILYFYPKDDTPGCTKEACSLRDAHQAIIDANAVVLGVSTDSTASHQKFSEKFGLPFTLIADTDIAVSNKYGVYGEKVRCGRTSLGINRTTFIINPEGVITRVFDKVNVEKHGEEVLAAIKAV